MMTVTMTLLEVAWLPVIWSSLFGCSSYLYYRRPVMDSKQRRRHHRHHYGYPRDPHSPVCS
jgi:hypothetical protein